MAHRTGNRWAPEKATGPAALALCRWFADSRFTGERYKLTVFVNDVQVKVLDIDPAAGSQWIDVPRRFLMPAENAKPDEKVQPAGQLPDRRPRALHLPVHPRRFRAGRQAQEHDRRLAGRRATTSRPRWNSTAARSPAVSACLEGSYQTFRNPLDQLPVGRRGMVNIDLSRQRGNWNTPEERQEYLVVTEPIPSGTTVIEKSVTGPFEHFEIGPGEITFYVGSRPDLGTIHYELLRLRAGQVPPSARRSSATPIGPSSLLVSAPKTLTVLPQGREVGRPLSPHAAGALRTGQAAGGQEGLRRGDDRT